MVEHILRCATCVKYTLEEVCSSCGSRTMIVKPAKFSLDDKYATYRRTVKLPEWQARGWY